jgi:hypothetical protein
MHDEGPTFARQHKKHRALKLQVDLCQSPCSHPCLHSDLVLQCCTSLISLERDAGFFSSASILFPRQLPPPFFPLYLLVPMHTSGIQLIMASLWAEHRLPPLPLTLCALSLSETLTDPTTSCMLVGMWSSHPSTILWPVMNTVPSKHWAILTSASSGSEGQKIAI